MRIADSTFQSLTSRALEKSQARVFAASERASAGAKVLRASDDPVAVSRITMQDAALEKLAGMQKSSGAARAELSGADRALGEADGLLSRARAIAVMGANGGLSGSDQATLAAEIEQIRHALFGVANTEEGGIFLFGGHETDSAPYSTSSYSGDSGVRSAEVAPGQRVSTSVAGDVIFSTPVDVFAELDGLAADLQAGSSDAVAGRLSTLDAGHEQIILARSALGQSFDGLDRADEARGQAEVGFLQARDESSGSDYVASALELVEAQNAMRAAIAAATRMLEGLQPSLRG